MKDILKTYDNGEITIHWKPSLCIHSKKCWTELPHVFNPREKPWVKPKAASTESIIAQIEKCPSGALSYTINNASPSKSTEHSDNTIEIAANGPILVHGTIEIKHADGRIEIKEKMCALCRCGGSSNKPFCDGTHHKIGFKA